MKYQLIVGMLLATGLCARGSVSYSTPGNSVNTTIPNGNPVGVAFNVDVTSGDIPAGYVISDLTVGLNISGGYNGGLVAYLVAPNGKLVQLLNQPGVSGSNPFGYGGSGLNVTLADGNPSIQSTSESPGILFSGTYGAAGSLSSLNGTVADGDWTLFFANLSSGGASGELTSFTLNLTAVPEPVGVGLWIFGGLMVIYWSLGKSWKKLKQGKLIESEL